MWTNILAAVAGAYRIITLSVYLHDPTPIPAISVADRTWILLGYASPSAGGEFDVTLSSRSQALQLQRLLAATG